MDAFPRVRTGLSRLLGVPPEWVTPEATLADLLANRAPGSLADESADLFPEFVEFTRSVADSLQVVELTLALEEEFETGESSSDSWRKLLNDTTVSDLIAFIERKHGTNR